MSKKCIWCGGEVNPNVIQGMYYCPRCDEDLTDKDVLPMTVFEKITESVETLAERLVYQFIAYDSHGLFVSCWRSTLTGDIEYSTRAEAWIATIEELKKEVEDE